MDDKGRNPKRQGRKDSNGFDVFSISRPAEQLLSGERVVAQGGRAGRRRRVERLGDYLLARTRRGSEHRRSGQMFPKGSGQRL